MGTYDDRGPGQFTVSVALTPGVFTEVYDSSTHGFLGLIDGAETVGASFAPVSARYVRLQVSAARAAIDEVEIFGSLNRLETGHPVRWLEGGSGYWDAQKYLKGDFDDAGKVDIARL